MDIKRIEANLHNFEKDYINLVSFQNKKGEFGGLIDKDTEEIFIVPPLSGYSVKEVHKFFADLCDAEKERYIDGFSGFSIAVPLHFFLRKAETFGVSPEKILMFRENILRMWHKERQ